MRLAKSLFLSIVVGALIALTANTSRADDSEIFTGSSSAGVPPNILFILDTSGSMSSAVTTQTPFDPTVTYTTNGNCNPNNIFYSNTGNPPACSSTQFFNASNLDCKAAVIPLGNSSSATGFYADIFIQWKKASGATPYSWKSSFSSSGTFVECKADNGIDGALGNTVSTHPIAGATATNTTAAAWTSSTSNYWSNGGAGTNGYALYSGDYVNWYNNYQTTTIGTRISVVQQAATNLINSLSNVNIGLMRYSNNNGGSTETSASGGMVAYPVSPVATNSANLITTLNSYSAGGWTPLSETLYEAYLYLSGGKEKFGSVSVPFHSVAASLDPAKPPGYYKSPIQFSCQKNFIVYLTDGLPTQDDELGNPSIAGSLINGLPNFSTLGGQCDDTTKSPYNGLDALGNPIPGGWGPTAKAGECMAALAKYMYNTDLSTTYAGQQNVQLYAIGFGDDPALASAYSWLNKAAVGTGGQAYTAGDLTSLQAVFTNIIGNILQTATTFTSPTVAVNAFNRTQTLNDLYISVFQPSPTYHWPGNVKKYSLQNGAIVDANGLGAVDPSTGFFKSSAQSFWSSGLDGAKVTLGGAANQLPNWDPSTSPHRNLYTYVGTNTPASSVDLTTSASAVVTTNSAITPAMLGTASTLTHDNIVNYARGEDVKDENGNGIINESRHAMGDPLHSQPSVVIYGGTTATPNLNDAVIYTATNDGYLHAFSVSDGHELWAFIPQELLLQLHSIYTNPSTTTKNYALDGNVRILKYDINGDGIIDPSAGDRVYLYVGQGRGGYACGSNTCSNYYALDVTNENAPKFMWSISPNHVSGDGGLPKLGYTWSTPEVAKVNIAGATQNANQLVLIFAGGYDLNEENYVYESADSMGNSIYMVDAISGSLLWSASNVGSVSTSPINFNLVLPRMDHSIPSDILVADLNGDGYADRMYVGDTAGQIWRFDITNGNSANSLVAGGVIASLGAHDDATPVTANARRFYNTPDVAAIRANGATPGYLNIAIGSGYRGHPLDTTIQDRLYAIRDLVGFAPMTQAQYNTFNVVHDTDLMDITTNLSATIPATSPGWKILLDQPGGWVGEKVLATSTTFNNQTFFVTYTPNAASASNPCTPGVGANQLYVVSAINGSPLPSNNRNYPLVEGGISPGVTFYFPGPTVTVPCTGSSCPPNPCTTNPLSCTPSPPVCLAGMVAPPPGVCGINSHLKTFWSEQDAN